MRNGLCSFTPRRKDAKEQPGKSTPSDLCRQPQPTVVQKVVFQPCKASQAPSTDALSNRRTAPRTQLQVILRIVTPATDAPYPLSPLPFLRVFESLCK
jgi:hypothetical protein